MSDTWSDIQAFKSKQSSFRERLQRRKKERENIVLAVDVPESSDSLTGVISKSGPTSPVSFSLKDSLEKGTKSQQDVATPDVPDEQIVASYEELEEKLLIVLCEVALNLPVDSRALVKQVSRALGLETKASHVSVENLLQKLSAQELIKVKESLNSEGETCLVVSWADHTKLQAVSNEYTRKGERNKAATEPQSSASRKRTADDKPEIELKEDIPPAKSGKHVAKAGSGGAAAAVAAIKEVESIESLLSLPSAREKETKKVGAEILELLSRPTAKEKSLVERFKSQGGAQVKEFCPHGIKEECKKVCGETCKKLHFKKIIQKHTDEALGDCSFLNTCFHMDTCKYVHYEVDYSATGGGAKGQVALPGSEERLGVIPGSLNGETVLYPTQWIQCDLRFFDMSILGKFAVIMADPPWDIHMELPYGTMSDDEMRQLNVPGLQDEGLIFLWVTGRAMELGRECLRLWGYTRCDEIIWVKTNQLQRIIRTGRTGHWLNHGKEHCLVGVKGNVEKFNRGLDCDVIVAEVRATSHKPDEIYGMIERLSPGTRKIELFGRPHNVQPNWMTLGNQLDGARLHDPALIQAFNQRYPDQNCMKKPD